MYDYGFRMYDPRIARFFTEDPLTGFYPELTPYQYASNCPIESVDLDGQERLSSKLLTFRGFDLPVYVMTSNDVYNVGESVTLRGRTYLVYSVNASQRSKTSYFIGKDGKIHHIKYKGGFTQRVYEDEFDKEDQAILNEFANRKPGADRPYYDIDLRQDPDIYDYELVPSTINIPYNDNFQLDFLGGQPNWSEPSTNLNLVSILLTFNPNLTAVASGNITNYEMNNYPGIAGNPQQQQQLMNNRAATIQNALLNNNPSLSGRVLTGTGMIVGANGRTGNITVSGTRTQNVEISEVKPKFPTPKETWE